jgi:hypothetical protein
MDFSTYILCLSMPIRLCVIERIAARKSAWNFSIDVLWIAVAEY